LLRNLRLETQIWGQISRCQARSQTVWEEFCRIAAGKSALPQLPRTEKWRVVATKLLDFACARAAYRRQDVLAPHDVPQGRQGPHVLAAGRSVRVGRNVVQQTVAHLGELDAQGRARAKALAHAILGTREQPELVPSLDEPDEAIPVRLNRVRLERGRTFGDVWLGWTLWRALRLRAAHRRRLVSPDGARGPAHAARRPGQ